MAVTKAAFETTFFTWSIQLIRNEKIEYSDFSKRSRTAFFNMDNCVVFFHAEENFTTDF